MNKDQGSWFEKIEGYFYLLPALLIMLIFIIYPFIQTIILSVYQTNVKGMLMYFKGLDNYVTLFSNPAFYHSILVTIIFVVITVAFGVLIGFTSALLCQKSFPGLRVFSAMYAMPMAIASSGIALIFQIMLNQSNGIINTLLGLKIGWLTDPFYALLCVGIITGWLNSGMNFLYFCAGLASIDRTLYESASIDGANTWAKFFYITLPNLRPITFFVVVTNIIQAFQAFGQIKIITMGGPGDATNVLVFDIYKNAFITFRYGYASAESVTLFIIVMILTFIIFKMRSKG